MDRVAKIEPQQIEKEEHLPVDPPSSQPQTESMEVHKHPHHLLHKKKWFEYLLEFIMIFLAVFLGFFAENIREHRADKDKFVKQIHTMIGSLQPEIKQFASILWENAIICKGLDSFRYEIDEAIAGRVHANKLYYYHWRYGRSWYDAISHVSAMSQLQNSGMLRFIKNDTLVYGMGGYYEQLSALLSNQRSELIKSRDALWNTYKIFFDLHGPKELVDRDTIVTSENAVLYNYYLSILNTKPALQLLSTDPKELKHLYMDVTLYELELHRFNSWVRTYIYYAGVLMKYILAEYKLNTGTDAESYASVGIVGSATANGWDTSTPMKIFGADIHQWEDTVSLRAGEVKFRANNNWEVNWGNSFFPTGIAIQNGTNIPIPTAGTYAVKFNDITGDYMFTVISPKYPYDMPH